MNNFKSLSIKGFIWNHLAKLSDYGLTYLISVILARNLDSESYGLFVTAYSIGTVLIILSSLGIDETINKYVSQFSANNKTGQIKKLLLTLFRYRLAAIVIILLLVFLFRQNISKIFNSESLSDYITVLVFFVFFQNLSNFFVQYFTALLNTRLVFFINTVLKLLSITSILIYLTTNEDLYIILILISSISFLSFVTYAFFAKQVLSYSSENFNNHEVKNFSKIMWLNAILSMVLGRYSDIFLLGLLIGITTEISYYEIAFSLTTVIDYVFSVGLIGVIISVFSATAVTDKSNILPIRNKIIKYYQFFVLPVMLFSLIFASDLINMIYSDKYSAAIILFQVLLFYKIVIVNVFGSGLNISILVSIGKQKYVFINRIILGIINIVLNIIFIPKYGALGAITITGFVLLIIYFIDFVLVNLIVELQYDLAFLIKNTILILPWLTVIYIINLSINFNIIILSIVFFTGLMIIYYFFQKSMLIKIKEDIKLFFTKT